VLPMPSTRSIGRRARPIGVPGPPSRAARGRILAGLLALCFVACSGRAGGRGTAPSASSRSPPVGAETVPVTKVTDGDTIHVTFHDADERVRLIGIDTPEVDWYGGVAECYGEEAGLYARKRLSGRTVALVFDSTPRDRYERLLAYVYVGGELINLTLVKQGFATADPVPPNTSMADMFMRAERDARAASRGLWSACPAP
jgi:micrococcal nuclease